MAQESGFGNFESNYDKVNRIDTQTWAKKKVYDERPYLVLPSRVFHMRLGDTNSVIKMFVRKLGEQFGDPIPLPALNSYTIKLRVKNSSGMVMIIGNMSVSDLYSGEIAYKFSPLDFFSSGSYDFDVEFTLNGTSFVLPDSSIKQEIIVSN